MELNTTKIKLEMERLGWKQTDLAKRMGVHRQFVNRFLANNDVGVSLKTISKFANALGIPDKDLIK